MSTDLIQAQYAQLSHHLNFLAYLFMHVSGQRINGGDFKPNKKTKQKGRGTW